MPPMAAFQPPRNGPPAPTKEQLKCYERGILNVHMDEEISLLRRACEGRCAAEESGWRWPEGLPLEADHLYTQEEWTRFGEEVIQLYREERYSKQFAELFRQLLQRENARLLPVGLTWCFDATMGHEGAEFILTWIPFAREAYELEQAGARRVANQPPPPTLKYAWYVSNAIWNRPSAATVAPVNHPLCPGGPAPQLMVENARSQSGAISSVKQRESPRIQSHLYQHGILSMHYRNGERGGGTTLLGFPSLPDEAWSLYTHQEWNRLVDELARVFRNQADGFPANGAIEYVIQVENARKDPKALKWVIDTMGMSNPYEWEFILTWVPNTRQRYEFLNPAARRVTEEGRPRNLKPHLLPPPSPSPISSSSVAISTHPPPILPAAPIAVPVPAVLEYPPILDEAEPPPPYALVVSAPPASSPPLYQTVSLHVDPLISNEGQPTHIVVPDRFSAEKQHSSMNSIPFTRNYLVGHSPSYGASPSPAIPPALQFCSFCGAKRLLGAGLFCSTCGKHIPSLVD